MEDKKSKKNKVIKKHPAVAPDYNDDDHGYTESEEFDKPIDQQNQPTKKIKSPKKSSVDEINDSVIEDSFMEKIVKYIKIDNLMRKETIEYKEKINTLKEEKQEMEACILRYLETKNEKVIQIADSGKLTKYESVRKSGLNKDIIKQSIIDQIKKEKLLDDNSKINELAEMTCQLMDSKRETKTKVVLKRTFKKDKAPKALKEPKTPKEQTDNIKPKKQKNTKK